MDLESGAAAHVPTGEMGLRDFLNNSTVKNGQDLLLKYRKFKYDTDRANSLLAPIKASKPQTE